MTLKFCPLFQSYQSIQSGVAVRKCPIQLMIGNFWLCVALKFDGWPWKTREHLFYATSRFEHHFTTIGEFKVKLQSGNAHFGSKSTILLSHVSLKFDRWFTKTTGYFFYATSSFVHHSTIIGEFKLELQSVNRVDR